VTLGGCANYPLGTSFRVGFSIIFGVWLTSPKDRWGSIRSILLLQPPELSRGHHGRYRYIGQVVARLQGKSTTFLARAEAGGTKAVAEALSGLSLTVALGGCANYPPWHKISSGFFHHFWCWVSVA